MAKAVTIIQPWAMLVAAGAKKCETRSWNTNYRGEVLIHASKKDPLWGAGMMDAEAWVKARSALGLPGVFGRTGEFPTGAIIGRANLVDCVRIDGRIRALVKEQRPDEYAFGDFTPGRYAWVMDRPIMFDEPIPASGKQGLWNWDGGMPA